MTPTKLFIYDVEDKEQAEGRFEPGEVVALAVSSVQHLQNGLARLVTDGFTFNRMLFQTHGVPGEIKFGKESLWHYLLDRDFVGKGYEKLFPIRTKIYFDGCNVASGNMGWSFLLSAGKVFLRSQGGVTVGYASYGYGYSSWVPFIGGHTIHFAGGLRFIEFKPGGVESDRFDSEDVTSLRETVGALGKLNSF